MNNLTFLFDSNTGLTSGISFDPTDYFVSDDGIWIKTCSDNEPCLAHGYQIDAIMDKLRDC